MIPWTVACQDPLSIGFSRQEYWSGWRCPPQRDLSDPWIEPTSLMSPVLAGRTVSQTWPISQGRTALLRERKQLWRALHGAQLPAWRGPSRLPCGQGNWVEPGRLLCEETKLEGEGGPVWCELSGPSAERSNVQRVPVWNSKFQVAGGSQQVLSLWEKHIWVWEEPHRKRAALRDDKRPRRVCILLSQRGKPVISGA